MEEHDETNDKKSDKRRLTVYLPVKLYKDVKKRAINDDLNDSEFAVKVFQDYLDKNPLNTDDI